MNKVRRIAGYDPFCNLATCERRVQRIVNTSAHHAATLSLFHRRLVICDSKWCNQQHRVKSERQLSRDRGRDFVEAGQDGERFSERMRSGEGILLLRESGQAWRVFGMFRKQGARQDAGVEEGHRTERRAASTASDNGVGGTAPVQTLSLPRCSTLPVACGVASRTIRPGTAETLSVSPAAMPAARRRSRESTIRLEPSSWTVAVMPKAWRFYGNFPATASATPPEAAGS